MNDKYRISSDEKIVLWGHGEWVEEPDFVEFEHENIQCKILRACTGVLNGYVRIPHNHPYYQKKYEEMDIECHGGLTFGECSDEHWIGFDCAHGFDLIPSHENLFKNNPALIESRKIMEELKEKFNLKNSPIFQQTYKSVAFCINQCKSIAEQLNELSKSVKSFGAL